MTTSSNEEKTSDTDTVELEAPPSTTTPATYSGGNSAYHPMLVTVELSKILPSSLNRDTTLSQNELAELVASFGNGPKPRLAQLPTGELQPGPGGFIRLIDGARRITALKECGKWDMVEMLVSPAGQLTAEEKLNLRTLAIWHRKDHSPFERAADLKLGYLTANAYRLGAGFDVEKLLGEAEDAGRQLALVVREVEQLLEALPEWSATRPAISWKAHLDSLGIEMHPTARRNLLKLLDVRPDLQELIGDLPVTISEVGLRGLSRLGEADQAQLVAALQRDPYKLAEQLAAITDKIRLEGWSVEQALTHFLALAQGTPSTGDDDPPLDNEADYDTANQPNRRDHANTTSAGGNPGASNQSQRRPANGYDRDSRGDGFEDMGWGGSSGGSYGSGYGGGADFEDGFEVEGLPKEIPPGLAERLDALAEDGILKLSDTARRSLAGLPPDDQDKVLNRLIEEPKLAGKLPSIVKIIRDEGWSLDAAIEEVLANTGKGGGAAKAGKVKSGTGGNGNGAVVVTNASNSTGKSKAELEQSFAPVQALAGPAPATPEEKLEVGATALVQLADQLSQALNLLKEALGEVEANQSESENQTPTEHGGVSLSALPPEFAQTITEALAAITTLADGFTAGIGSDNAAQVTPSSQHLAA